MVKLKIFRRIIYGRRGRYHQNLKLSRKLIKKMRDIAAAQEARKKKL
jgi:hypothetical protein